jgi:hypothetical protein
MLSEIGVSPPEAEAMIMAARLKAGWIEAPAAAPAEVEAQETPQA